MSVLGANVIAISLAPRIECDRTRVTPGTMLTASSKGPVTLKTTCPAPGVEPRRVHDEHLVAAARRHEGLDGHGHGARVHGRHDSPEHRFADAERPCRPGDPGSHRHGA